MPDIYELTNEDLNRAKNLFRRIPVYNPEIIRYTAQLKDIDIDSKLFDKMKMFAESSITSNKLSNSDFKKHIEDFRELSKNLKDPFKINDARIKKRYNNFINQYKNYFNKNNFLMPDNFEEFSFWFTACLHPTKQLFQLDIKDSDFKLFHDYKERLFNDNNWDEYKEAHLLNFYNTDIIILLSSNIIKEKREDRKLKKRISISIYQNILEQYEIYFDKSFSKNPNSFKLFLMWFARCQHPNESLENIDVTDKDIYQFIEYKDIKENDRAWSDVQERERLKSKLRKVEYEQIENEVILIDEQSTQTINKTIQAHKADLQHEAPQKPRAKPGRKRAVAKDAREYLKFYHDTSKEMFLKEIKKLGYIHTNKEFAHLIMAIDYINKLEKAPQKEWQLSFEKELKGTTQTLQNFNNKFRAKDIVLVNKISKELTLIISKNSLQ